MAVKYCSTAELVEFTGSTLDATTVLTPLIEKADREIDARLAEADVTGSAGDEDLKNACIDLATVNLIIRQQMDGSRPGSLSLGGNLSFSNNLDALVRFLRDDAKAHIESYIKTTDSGPTYIVKVKG
jgi:hypothetical protein